MRGLVVSALSQCGSRRIRSWRPVVFKRSLKGLRRPVSDMPCNFGHLKAWEEPPNVLMRNVGLDCAVSMTFVLRAPRTDGWILGRSAREVHL
ncbi:hypothetical protein K466DRAFT_163776 [Polyporus arcularius HHB13444]|uniref:Uncharacterized protein n=1 Tax=Polyporus arcularius HHB13444 TaxID=1314778 RepID=A0A5C3PB21_9APHY|nr:hypothetical protein K466DRAFT_163776 [Polyporus arcularius HHB13444]